LCIKQVPLNHRAANSVGAAFFVEAQNVERQNVERQNVERQNVEIQFVEIKMLTLQNDLS
jgi:hypothetical protein